jgi:galactokinase/mevalonate kinase-like predicted kinase
MITLYEKLQEAADIPHTSAVAEADDDLIPLLDYVCTVVHTVLKNQARKHQQLQKDHQELSEAFKQNKQQHDTYIQELTTSETYLLAQRIQQSWVLKLWKSVRKQQ